ncbi:LOW QUALITY PROTEIN: MORC family CW-type zinc finger protein 4-like [Sarcoramphus papa]
MWTCAWTSVSWRRLKRDHPSIGLYGFKSGSMRRGKDAIIFTKTGGALSVGLLSQTYTDRVHAETVIISLVSFNQQNEKMIVTEDSPSPEAILEHTVFNTREELLAQFDAIPGKKGMHILIWNIRRNKDGKLELDFDTDEHDIGLADFLADDGEISSRKVLCSQKMVPEFPGLEMEYSLWASCSILYLKPRMIVLQKKVNTQLIAKSLANVEYDFYKPRFISKRVKITFGFTCKNKSHYGIMMYHNNWLIRSYEKVGLKGGGVGVIGVIECNFLNRAHNKEDFEEGKDYRERPDQMWVPCEECLKWRKLPDQVDPTVLPESWFCHLHLLPKYRSCLAPQEQEYSDEKRPKYRQKCQKGELDGRRKRRLSSSSGESVEQQVRQEGEGCMSQHRESLDTAGLGRFSALPHCYLCSLLPREMPTCEDVGA